MLARDSSMSSLFKSHCKEGTEVKSANYSSVASKMGKVNISLSQNDKIRLYSQEKENMSGYHNFSNICTVSSPTGNSQKSTKVVRTHMRHPSPQIVINEKMLGDYSQDSLMKNEVLVETPKTPLSMILNNNLAVTSKRSGGGAAVQVTNQYQLPMQGCSSRSCKSKSITNYNSTKPPSKRRIVFEEVLKKINLFKSQYPENQRLLEYLRKKSDMNKLTYYNYLQESDRNVVNGLVQILYDKLETVLTSEEDAEKCKSTEKLAQNSANSAKLACKSGAKYEGEERSNSDVSAMNYLRYSNILHIVNEFVWLIEELKKEFMMSLEEKDSGKLQGKHSSIQPSVIKVRLTPFENLIHEFRKNHEKFMREYSQLYPSSEAIKNRNIPVDRLLDNLKKGSSPLFEIQNRTSNYREALNSLNNAYSDDIIDVQKSLEDYQKIKQKLDTLLKNDMLVKPEDEYYEFTLGKEKEKTIQHTRNTLRLDDTKDDSTRWSLNTTKYNKSNRSGFMTDDTFREINNRNLELQANVEELYRELNSLKQSNFQEKLEEESKEKAFKDEIMKLRDQIDLLTIELVKKEKAIEDLQKAEAKCLGFENAGRRITDSLEMGVMGEDVKNEVSQYFGEKFLKGFESLSNKAKSSQEHLKLLYERLKFSEKIALLKELRFLYDFNKQTKDAAIRDGKQRKVTFELSLDKETVDKRLREIDDIFLDYQKESQLGLLFRDTIESDILENPDFNKIDISKIEKLLKMQANFTLDLQEDLEKKSMISTIDDLKRRIDGLTMENRNLYQSQQQQAGQSAFLFDPSDKNDFKNFRRINNKSRDGIKLEVLSNKKQNVAEKRNDCVPNKLVNEDFLKMIFLQAHSIEQLL